MACRKRHILMSICIIQIISVLWRQIFDYLGFMWGPILINFFHIIFVIFGFFGVWQFKSKYVLSYAIWSIFWCGWNVFIICFYENVGVLNRELDLLNFGTGSISWWESNGPGCKALFLANKTSGIETDIWGPLRPDIVSGCYFPYHHLEASQAFFHFIFSVTGSLYSIFLIGSIKKQESEEEGNTDNPSAVVKKAKPALYSVEYMPHRSNDSMNESMDDGEVGHPSSVGGARPMTPRRVKRRSVHSRGHPPQYNSNRPVPLHHSHTLRRSGGSRSSGRSSGRRHRQNPVTKLLDHQAAAVKQEMGGGHRNLMYQGSSANSLNEVERPSSARSSYSNYHGMRSHSYRHSHTFLSTGPPAYTSYSDETAI